VLRLDLKSTQGQAILRDHLVHADVLIEGFRPGVMARLGYGWDALHARFPFGIERVLPLTERRVALSQHQGEHDRDHRISRIC
jgi:hypothetical protein